MVYRRKRLAPKKEAKKERGYCRECKLATLLQWENGPIITDCPKGRMVGSMWGCEKFEKDPNEKPIVHLKLNEQYHGNNQADS